MLFTKEQSNALKKAVKKWEDILNNEEEDRAREDCECCLLWWDTNCVGCPISQIAGTYHCNKTPYAAWHDHHSFHHDLDRVTVKCEICEVYAEAELKFLKDVLNRTILFRSFSSNERRQKR